MITQIWILARGILEVRVMDNKELSANLFTGGQS